MNIHDTMHYLAQGAINVAEGIDANPYNQPTGPGTSTHKRGAFVEQGSRIAQALESICKLLPPGEAHFDIKGARIKEDRPRQGLAPQFWVMHPSNDAILVTCKTRKDAEAVVTCLDTLAAFFGARQ
jgi:hypothetical protein